LLSKELKKEAKRKLGEKTVLSASYQSLPISQGFYGRGIGTGASLLAPNIEPINSEFNAKLSIFRKKHSINSCVRVTGFLLLYVIFNRIIRNFTFMSVHISYFISK